MKKWNNPEIAELDLKMTAEDEETCTYSEFHICNAPAGPGSGNCNNCVRQNPTNKKDYSKAKNPSDFS